MRITLQISALTLLFLIQSDQTGASEPSPPDELKKADSEPQPAKPELPPKVTSSQPDSGSKPTENSKKRNSDLDRQLLRDLLPELDLELPAPAGKSGDESTEGGKKSAPISKSRIQHADELDETVEAMREVSRRLDKLNLTDETEQLQTGIVTNIDALIEKLRNTPPPPSSSNSSDQSNPDQSDQNSSQDQQTGSKQQPQQTPQKQQGADSTSGGAAPQPQQGKSGESSEENLRQARERAATLARRRALVDEVWGHLPPAMRERLLNVGSEKLLPKYEELIRRYYEALAEPERTGSKR